LFVYEFPFSFITPNDHIHRLINILCACGNCFIAAFLVPFLALPLSILNINRPLIIIIS
jgi:hypothetical protein